MTEKILAAMKSKKRPYSTGLRKLDEAMGGGLYPGKSYGFAARKKVGKTILAGTISCNLAQQAGKRLGQPRTLCLPGGNERRQKQQGACKNAPHNSVTGKAGHFFDIDPAQLQETGQHHEDDDGKDNVGSEITRTQTR